MPAAKDIHALHPSDALPASSASELKNAFKGVFQQALEGGAVSITRSGKREAILLSTQLYDQIVAELAARDPLETLRQDYDKRFASMQGKAAQKSYDAAFGSSSSKLGKAAVARAKAKGQ